MREKCRLAAIKQHNEMSDEQKIQRIENISRSIKETYIKNPLMGHHTLHKDSSKEKISMNRIGKGSRDSNGNWKGGVTSLNKQLRGDSKYKIWRLNIFRRDDFTCQVCNCKNRFLHAHHITPFSEERDNFDLDNGITLCYECHEIVHGKRFGKGSSNKTKTNEEVIYNGGLAAHSGSNTGDSIAELSGDSVMRIRTEGMSKICQGQRIEGEKI